MLINLYRQYRVRVGFMLEHMKLEIKSQWIVDNHWWFEVMLAERLFDSLSITDLLHYIL